MKKDLKNKNFCIYIHLNKINNKAYIGQTCGNPKYRWGRNGNRYYHNEYFLRAIQKYGWENFEHVIWAEGLTADEANRAERLLIALFNTTNQEFGYNIAFGGDNFSHSEITKQKMSKTRTGRKYSKEWCENISKALKGKKDVNKAAIEAHRKKVKCIETGKVYSSQVAAQEDTGISRKWISSCINGYQKTAGGFHWESV
jgi:group I intron endonuclease